MTTRRPQKPLYIFLDEGGNLDFSAKGTKYFSLTCVSMQRPFPLYAALDNYKYDLVEFGLDVESFHCADDNKHMRQKFFSILRDNLQKIRIDSLLVEKRKTVPGLQNPHIFYPKMLGYLLRYVINGYQRSAIDEVIIITDTIPLKRKRAAIEKSTKAILAGALPADTKHLILHHASKAHYGLQIADYCNWAIFRKWERGQNEHYNIIRAAMMGELDIFRRMQTKWY